MSDMIAAPRPPDPSWQFVGRMAPLLWGTGSAAAVLLLWQGATSLLAISPVVLPSPLLVGQDMLEHAGLLARHALVTCEEVVLGFVMSVVIGLAMALALTASRRLEQAIYPLIIATQTMPKVALAPLVLAWFGFGLRPKVIIVILVAFFPIIINSMVGLNALSPQVRNLARSMGATRLQMFWRFQLPSALPGVFAGMKVASGLAVIGAVVAEFVGADDGLGYMIMVATSDLDIAREFSAIIMLTAIGLVLYLILEQIERSLLPWHISVRDRKPGA